MLELLEIWDFIGPLPVFTMAQLSREEKRVACALKSEESDKELFVRLLKSFRTRLDLVKEAGGKSIKKYWKSHIFRTFCCLTHQKNYWFFSKIIPHERACFQVQCHKILWKMLALLAQNHKFTKKLAKSADSMYQKSLLFFATPFRAHVFKIILWLRVKFKRKFKISKQ